MKKLFFIVCCAALLVTGCKDGKTVLNRLMCILQIRSMRLLLKEIVRLMT